MALLIGAIIINTISLVVNFFRERSKLNSFFIGGNLMAFFFLTFDLLKKIGGK